MTFPKVFSVIHPSLYSLSTPASCSSSHLILPIPLFPLSLDTIIFYLPSLENHYPHHLASMDIPNEIYTFEVPKFMSTNGRKRMCLSFVVWVASLRRIIPSFIASQANFIISLFLTVE